MGWEVGGGLGIPTPIKNEFFLSMYHTDKSKVVIKIQSLQNFMQYLNILVEWILNLLTFMINPAHLQYHHWIKWPPTSSADHITEFHSHVM